MHRTVVICLIFLVLVVTACGGGGESETVETSSGAPPRLVNLKGTFEHRIRNTNDVSDLICEDSQEPDVMAAEEVWDCDLTMAQSGDKLEIDVLVGVSSGDYTVLDCRSSPRERYSQAPRGICKKVR